MAECINCGEWRVRPTMDEQSQKLTLKASFTFLELEPVPLQSSSKTTLEGWEEKQNNKNNSFKSTELLNQWCKRHRVWGSASVLSPAVGWRCPHHSRSFPQCKAWHSSFLRLSLTINTLQNHISTLKMCHSTLLLKVNVELKIKILN